MKEFETLALAMIYPGLPPHIKDKVMHEILKRFGFEFSLEDLKPAETPMPPILTAVAMPVYKPAIYCSFCREKLKELDETEERTVELEAKLLDAHLDTCPIFQVIEKHRKIGRQKNE